MRKIERLPLIKISHILDVGDPYASIPQYTKTQKNMRFEIEFSPAHATLLFHRDFYDQQRTSDKVQLSRSESSKTLILIHSCFIALVEEEHCRPTMIAVS